MVTFEDVADDEPPAGAAWEERLLDAEEIERAAAALKRPTARMQLESLAKRLRREGEALKRVERSQQQAMEEKKEEAEGGTGNDAAASSSEATPAAAPPSATTTDTATTKPAPPPVVSSSVKYVPIDRFAFDAGGYNAPFVTLYVDLPGVGSIPRENVECSYTPDSFDLIVKDLRGKSYRLFKDSLEKDIDPEKSKIVVKADKVVVKLAKVKQSDYGGFDYWSKLTDTKKKKKGEKDDPSSSIMDLMKQMYDEGDDSMKKMIGETLAKQRSGELGKDRDSPDDFMKDDF